MSIEPLKGFQSLETHHCVTGSMRHVYLYNQHPLTEEMLLGVGGGVGFVYWHMKGTDPFIGGRRSGLPGHGFERCAGHRTGVRINEFTTSSHNKAEQALRSILNSGQPVMLQVDMGFLPYFDFGGYNYHFGAHTIVVWGYDQGSGNVLIADRDKPVHVVSMNDLSQARGSKHKPYPPNHRWFTFDFNGKHPPTADGVTAAIAEQATDMLNPPIRNLGVSGIRKAAQMVPGWHHAMNADSLRRSMFYSYILIDATGGTGGGLFRYMFSRFLGEAAAIIGTEQLRESAKEFRSIGDRWQAVADIFRQGSQANSPMQNLADASKHLLEVADLEEAAWNRLAQFVE